MNYAKRETAEKTRLLAPRPAESQDAKTTDFRITHDCNVMIGVLLFSTTRLTRTIYGSVADTMLFLYRRNKGPVESNCSAALVSAHKDVSAMFSVAGGEADASRTLSETGSLLLLLLRFNRRSSPLDGRKKKVTTTRRVADGE